MLERKKLKSRSPRLSDSQSHGVYKWDKEELTFLISFGSAVIKYFSNFAISGFVATPVNLKF